jgi:hypothetical protein
VHRLAPALLLVTLTQPLADAQQAPPGDCEVRTWRDGFTNDRHTSLTLMLRGPKGQLPVNLVVTAIHQSRAPRGKPADVRLDFTMPLFVGQVDFKRPNLKFTVDRGLDTQRFEEASLEGTGALPSIDHVILPYDLASLKTLAGASTIDGRLFGIDFVLTARQVRAIQDFYRSESR